MKNLIAIFICTTVLILLGNVPIQAQYLGGQGDGAQKSSTIQITLNGNQINAVALYQGGQSDGHDKKIIIATLAGDLLADLYGGGYNDGNSKNSFQGTLTGDELSDLYSGGAGDGSHKTLYQGTMDGTLIEVLYSGGIGDGNDKNSFSGILTGEEIAQLYEGGTGDGANKIVFSGILTGEEIAQLYQGGFDDGIGKDLFIGLLDGNALSALYSGGIGDGFSKHSIQYIFDFPGCTFVVNTDDSGFGSLRYAIGCAAPGDTIDFSPLLIQDSIVLTSSNLEITKDLFVNGNKSAELTIDASQVFRAMKTGSNTITIKGLKIIIGTAASGGAALNNGILTLMDVDIYDPTNNATSVIENSLSGSLRIKGEVTIQEN